MDTFSPKEWIAKNRERYDAVSSLAGSPALFAFAFSCRYTPTYAVGQEEVRFDFEKLPFSLREVRAAKLPECPSNLLKHAIGKVKVTLFFKEGEKKRQLTAEFTSTELIAILGDQWPCPENIGNIRRSIRDRKFYPLDEVQQQSEKSHAAQGQTKKPGSHSASRHG